MEEDDIIKKDQIRVDMKEGTSMVISKYVLIKLKEFSDYIDAYSLKSHTRSESLLLALKCVDRNKLNKILDKTNELYKINGE